MDAYVSSCALRSCPWLAAIASGPLPMQRSYLSTNASSSPNGTRVRCATAWHRRSLRMRRGQEGTARRGCGAASDLSVRRRRTEMHHPASRSCIAAAMRLRNSSRTLAGSPKVSRKKAPSTRCCRRLMGSCAATRLIRLAGGQHGAGFRKLLGLGEEFIQAGFTQRETPRELRSPTTQRPEDAYRSFSCLRIRHTDI